MIKQNLDYLFASNQSIWHLLLFKIRMIIPITNQIPPMIFA